MSASNRVSLSDTGHPLTFVGPYGVHDGVGGAACLLVTCGLASLEPTLAALFCRERVSNTTQTEFNIQNLKPDTTYEVRVRAYNRFGPSQREATVVVTTDQEGESAGMTVGVCVGGGWGGGSPE